MAGTGLEPAETVSSQKDASELVLKEIEQVVSEQLDNFKNLTSRAGTVLSVLIGAITATLTISGVVARPPLWALVLPAILLIAAIIVACIAFMGTDVASGPQPESLAIFIDAPEATVRSALIGFYQDLVAGKVEEDGTKVPGNRELLERKAFLFRLSVWLLAATILATIIIAVVLYTS